MLTCYLKRHYDIELGKKFVRIFLTTLQKNLNELFDQTNTSAFIY